MSAQSLAQKSLPSDDSQSPQNKLGNYTLLEKIAQGGMAQVFKAKTVDPAGIERLVVIKRILPHISLQPEYVEMLIDEAKIAVHFTHGNIAQVYDLGRVGQDYFIVMEYVDGRTFSQINRALIERHQRMPLDILLYCFSELCQGLSYIHRKTGPTGKHLGVVHRDVSPQNIILSYAGNVKVIDFGVAKAGFIADKTEHGVLKGKFAYMSPEQTRAESIDHRSDIFSVGVLLWEMATGERLFKRGTNQETIKAVQKGKYDNASERRADVPKALDRIVKKALGKTPRSRYQDAADMAFDVEKLLFSVNPGFRPVSAAKFLYDLFGPDPDESGLPPPFFVKAGALPERGRTHNTAASQRAKANDDDAPTVKEPFHDEATPIVKIPRLRRIPGFNAIVMGLVFLIFALGSFYAYHVHELNKKAYVSFSGSDPAMRLFIDGKPEGFPGEGEITLESRKVHEIKILRDGYKDYIQQESLDPREHAHIVIDMEQAIPPFGDLTIETEPAGAAIFVGGKEWADKTPATLKNLAHGQKYQIRLSLPNYNDVVREVEIMGGKEISLDQPLTVNYGAVTVDSQPQGAEVDLDGVKAGVTPFHIEKIMPGEEHSLRVVLSGYPEQTLPFTLAPGEQKSLHVELAAQNGTSVPAPEPR